MFGIGEECRRGEGEEGRAGEVDKLAGKGAVMSIYTAGAGRVG